MEKFNNLCSGSQSRMGIGGAEMKIESITCKPNWQDLGRAIFICEFCNHREEGFYYDDPWFYYEIVHRIHCKNCKKERTELTQLELHYKESNPQMEGVVG